MKTKEDLLVMYDNALLKTINEIAKRFEPTISFQDFDQASSEENIVKFVLNYFHIYKRIDIEDITNFQNLIDFLSKKPNHNEQIDSQYIHEPKFNILVFNFKTKELRKPSAISFYSNFLNFYFLKKSRQELYNRCRILLKKKDETSEQDNLLRKWTTYVDLCNIINYTKTGNEAFFIDEKIIDKEFLDNCPINEKLPDAIYYQLQFIFNYLDCNVPIFPLIESLYIALNKVQQINVKGIDFIKVITQSIRVKNISFILQKKKYERVIQNDSTNAINSRISEETDSNDDQTPSTFEKRLKLTMQDKMKKYQDNKMIYKDFNDFWNCSDTDFEFGNDIFFDNVDGNKKNEDDWKTGIDYFLEERGFESTQNKDFKYPQTDPSGKGKLYKIFYYNETDSKWHILNGYVNNFFAPNNIKCPNSKTPLIYFSNSKEDELANLISKLINTSYPDINNINDNEIYVYAFCDKSLQSIAGDKSLQLSKEEEEKKPILLILHVPEVKKKLSNIKTIVFQISTFLSFICDIEIVVLNKTHYVDQISRIIDVENIKRSYTNASKILSNQTYIERFEDFKDYLDDDFKPDSGKPNLSKEDLDSGKPNDIDTSSLSELSEKVFQKCHKLLFILDDEKFEYQSDFEMRKSHNHFIKLIGNKIYNDCNKLIPNFTVINLKNTNTYKGFRDAFINLARSIQTESGEAITNFKCIQISNMSSVYFRLKSKKDYKDKLKEISLIRFQMLEFDKLYKSQNLFIPQNKNEEEEEEENGYNQYNDLRHLSEYSILFDLQKELYSICPPMDLQFCNECNTVIKDMESEILAKSNNIKKELKESYSDIITKLINTIRKRLYWTDEAKFDLKLSYDQYLNDAYFKMIFGVYPPKEAASIHQNEKNLDALKSLIKEGREVLDAEFKRKEEEIAHMKKTKVQELKDKIKKGTDYHIREIENENEFKLTAEVGKNINDYMEHDF